MGMQNRSISLSASPFIFFVVHPSFLFWRNSCVYSLTERRKKFYFSQMHFSKGKPAQYLYVNSPLSWVTKHFLLATKGPFVWLMTPPRVLCSKLPISWLSNVVWAHKGSAPRSQISCKQFCSDEWIWLIYFFISQWQSLGKTYKCGVIFLNCFSRATFSPRGFRLYYQNICVFV